MPAKAKPGPKPSGVTPPVQMRLKPETLAKLDALVAHHALDSRTDAVRTLVDKAYVATGLGESRKKGRK